LFACFLEKEQEATINEMVRIPMCLYVYLMCYFYL
jgi:hypothetical protein